MKHYILVNKKPVALSIPKDIEKIMEFEKSPEKHIGRTELGNFFISTVFLGIDHKFGDGEPILFETMIFKPYEPILKERWDDHTFEYYQTRCSTYEQAVVMHGRAIRTVKKYHLELSANAVLKAGALAIAAILLIYITL